jgi:hypothetical protein
MMDLAGKFLAISRLQRGLNSRNLSPTILEHSGNEKR